jgi:hypothetical protein
MVASAGFDRVLVRLADITGSLVAGTWTFMGLDKPRRSHIPDHSGAIMTFTSPLISADVFAALQRARWNTVSDSSLPIYASITLHGRLQRDTIFPSPPSSSIDTQNFKFLKFQFSKGANLYAYAFPTREKAVAHRGRLLFVSVRHGGFIRVADEHEQDNLNSRDWVASDFGRRLEFLGGRAFFFSKT